MAKPRKGSDRRQVAERLRREQQRRERRRTYLVVAVCAVVAAAIIAFAAYPTIRQNAVASGALGTLGADRAKADCLPLRTRPAVGNQDHKQVGTDIAYPFAPPAFGPHYPQPAPFDTKYYSVQDRPRIEFLVHNLEHGYTLLWYEHAIADDADRLAVVKAIASKFGSNQPSDKFIAVPWKRSDGKAFPKGTHVALTHWSAGGDPTDPSKQMGVWRYCAAPSGAVVKDFMRAYPFTDSPEPNGM